MHLEPTGAWWLLGVCAALVVAFLLTAHFTKLKTKLPRFYSWIGAIAIFGGALAFLLPIALNSGFGKDDDGRVLRQLILYATGGLLGVITLGETHRKNNQEKEKNENDHTRQVYAERRSRYTKAVEQLANEKAAVRLGGIYTLVGLVDEWLADDTLAPEERQKEGQVIINNLCSYIRSPFPLAAKIEEYEAHKKLEELKKKESENILIGAEPFTFNALSERFTNTQNYKKPKDITTDYAKFHEEQDVRRTIFVEMSKRSSTFAKKHGKIIETIPGMWSAFDFDFSRAPIFYPLNNLTIEKPNFSSGRFYGEISFLQTTFVRKADFFKAIFIRRADFTGTTFIQDADFTATVFTHEARFGKATFIQTADFKVAVFTQNARFSMTTFTQEVRFGEATFTQNANFSWATFTQDVSFRKTTFTKKAVFKSATFAQSAYFTETIFKENSPIFVYPSKTSDRIFRARFATLSGFRRAHDFTVSGGNKPIKLGTATLLGKPFDIPIGTVLFDPNSWDEENKKYTRVSEPAKPLDKSNDGEEDKPE